MLDLVLIPELKGMCRFKILEANDTNDPLKCGILCDMLRESGKGGKGRITKI
jgi:hypothetical protein